MGLRERVDRLTLDNELIDIDLIYTMKRNRQNVSHLELAHPHLFKTAYMAYHRHYITDCTTQSIVENPQTMHNVLSNACLQK